MRHRVIVLAGITALALVLVACGGGAATQGGGAQQPAGGAGQATRPDLVVATPTPTVPGAPTSTPIGGGQAYVVMPPARPTTAPTEEAAAEPEVTAFDATAGTGQALDRAWQAAFRLPPEALFTITISQEELTAALTNRLKTVEAVKSVTATLADGQITLDLTLTIENRDVTAKVVFSVTVDEEGQAAVEVISAEIAAGAQGGVNITLPDEVLSAANDALAQALTGAGAQNQVDVTFTEITVTDGIMTLSGYVAP
jgi:hypothetical protein